VKPVGASGAVGQKRRGGVKKVREKDRNPEGVRKEESTSEERERKLDRGGQERPMTDLRYNKKIGNRSDSSVERPGQQPKNL